ncbi:MAG: glutamate--tRNA ligase family protein, partial [Pseudomonadales bacterium]
QVGDAEVAFTDLIAGTQSDRLAHSCGDFVIRRRDGLMAYQLATAVDDGDPTITHVMRGGDLLDNTARQIHLMSLLGLSVPVYAHVRTLLSEDGKKLSKQTHARALDNATAAANLVETLVFLGLTPPHDAARWSPSEVLEWAIGHFEVDTVPSGTVIYRRGPVF